MKDMIEAIVTKNKGTGIKLHAPVRPTDIPEFERHIGFALPAGFAAFYTICNGFECLDDMFNIIPLDEIGDYGTNWFYFAEYMIYSDMWA